MSYPAPLEATIRPTRTPAARWWLSLLLLGACQDTSATPPVEAPPPVAPVEAAAPTAAPAPERAPRDPVLDDAARFLAGLPLPEGSALAALAADPAYVSYAGRIDAAWQKYEVETGSKIAAWSQQALADLPPGPVFYPFSGPDLLNAVTLFPRGTSYTMLGLEPLGAVPDLASESPAAVTARLAKLERAMVHILGRNYFITDSMAKDLGDGEEHGVTSVMMFFLARTGHEIVGARVFSLSPTGEVSELSPDEAATRGVELRFRKAGSDAVQVARYFPGNAADDHFTFRPGLTQHLEGLGGVVTLAKAASYLMYYHAFDDVRSVVLSRSTAIVTESSGLPFHYLDTEDWALRLYGTYDKPIKDYADRCQPELKQALKERGLGELPFYFGYQYRTATHLIVARRAEGRPLADPVYDASKKLGNNTLCEDDKVRTIVYGPR